MTVKDTVKDTAENVKAIASDKLAVASEKLHDAGSQLRDSAEAARTSAGETLTAAREKAGELLETAKEKSADAYAGTKDYAATAAEAAREKANAAYSSARETASTVKHKTADSIEESPLAALIGGVAIGVLLGALLPRSQREAETLGPVGEKLGLLAKNALAAAKAAGQDTLDELGVNKDAARQQVDKLIDTASKAASSAGTAAVETVRAPQGGTSGSTAY